MILQREKFRVKFDNLIQPDITFDIDEKTTTVSGSVKVAIDKMLNDFTGGLGLKSVVDKLIERKTDDSGCLLDIKGIAVAYIFVKNAKLHVKAEYRASKEWWAKPVALVVLGKLLNDFAAKIDNCGIYPGFRLDIKGAMQQLRKENYAILNLKNLFDEQTFCTEYSKVTLTDFKFVSVNTSSENGNFVIDFLGTANIKKEAV